MEASIGLGMNAACRAPRGDVPDSPITRRNEERVQQVVPAPQAVLAPLALDGIDADEANRGMGMPFSERFERLPP